MPVFVFKKAQQSYIHNIHTIIITIINSMQNSVIKLNRQQNSKKATTKYSQLNCIKLHQKQSSETCFGLKLFFITLLLLFIACTLYNVHSPFDSCSAVFCLQTRYMRYKNELSVISFLHSTSFYIFILFYCSHWCFNRWPPQWRMCVSWVATLNTWFECIIYFRQSTMKKTQRIPGRHFCAIF